MSTKGPVVIHRLEALDDDGLSWGWDCGGHRFLSTYAGQCDSWVLARVDGQPEPVVLEEIDCISFRETVLHSVDMARRGGR